MEQQHLLDIPVILEIAAIQATPDIRELVAHREDLATVVTPVLADSVVDQDTQVILVSVDFLGGLDIVAIPVFLDEADIRDIVEVASLDTLDFRVQECQVIVDSLA